MRPRILATLAIVLVCGFGCATAMHGTRERISVTSTPEGARVLVEPGATELTTPASVELDRGSAYVLTFELAGHRSRALEVAPEYSWMHLGNLLAGGVVGGMIDEKNGAAFKLEPNPAHAALSLLGDPPAFPWQIEVLLPADAREVAEAASLASAGLRCNESSPFGGETAYAVQQRLRGKLVNSDLFAGVSSGAEGGGRGAVRAEVLAMCSHVAGILVMRAVGVTSLRLVLERNGVVFLEKTYSAAVDARDESYTGSQNTTAEQVRIRSVLDSLNRVLEQFVSDLRATSEMWSGGAPIQ